MEAWRWSVLEVVTLPPAANDTIEMPRCRTDRAASPRPAVRPTPLFRSHGDLPQQVTGGVTSQRGREMFRLVANEEIRCGGSRERALQIAWAALAGAGYTRRADGKWRRQLTGGQGSPL